MKIPFSKLKISKVGEEVKTIKYNDIEIEVKSYLPANDKLKLIANVLNNSMDDNNFPNPLKIEIIAALEIVYAYSNLTFTDKQKEDPAKLYDLLETNDIINLIISAIPENEYKSLFDYTTETIEKYYEYRNSVLGILEQVSTDYSQLKFDAESIQKNIADPENLTLLKDIMQKLG